MVNPYPRWRLAEEGEPNATRRRRDNCYKTLLTLQALPLPDEIIADIRRDFMWDMREQGFRRQYAKVLTELRDLVYFKYHVIKTRSMPNLAVASKYG